MYKTSPSLNFISGILQQYLILLLELQGLASVQDTYIYINTFHRYAYFALLELICNMYDS